MNSILDFKTDDELIIKKVKTDGTLKQRLLSFGIIKGAKIKLLGFSPTKSTVELRVGKMNIALRRDEALSIEVDYETN